MHRREYVKHQASSIENDDGTLMLRSDIGLGPVAKNTGQWQSHWADKTPDHPFLMERSGPGWRQISYLEAFEQTKALAATLLSRGMGPDTPIVVLSGPGIDHAILMLAAHYIGAPIAPLAEQYSLLPEAVNRLEYCIGRVKPALVYANDGDKFARALNSTSLSAMKKLVSVNVAKNADGFEQLLRNTPTLALEAAHKNVGPDTLAKILFTSGSTGNPKGVPQTQGMLTVNQAQYLSCLSLLGERPPVLLDWLPWNHVFAGNSNFNMILSNGGTLIIDDGKPVKGLFDRTLENLAMHTGTLSFNVPIAYRMLVDALQKDKLLKSRFFSDLDIIFYAGASLPSDIWSALEKMSMQVAGKIPMMTSSWGLTETAPACLIHHQGGAETGMIGVPVPALDVKLIPYQGERYEIRVKGPNVITSYFDALEIDEDAFDDDGFFITNDAVKFVDNTDYSAGVRFDGRITEDFKLLSGTWVQAAALRLKALASLGTLVQDVVVVGADRRDVGLLVFPSPAIKTINDGLVVTDDIYTQSVVDRLLECNVDATGSSNRIARVLITAQLPSIKDAEITAKGSLNIKSILDCRAALIDRLYNDSDAACHLVTA